MHPHIIAQRATTRRPWLLLQVWLVERLIIFKHKLGKHNRLSMQIADWI